MPPIGGDTQHHEPAGDTAMILYRLSEISKKQDDAKADFKDFKDDYDEYKKAIESRLRAVEDLQTRMSERLTIWNMGQAAFTTIAAAAAALFGHKGP